MDRQKLQRVAVTSASSVLAVLVALVICAVLLLITGKDPIEAYSTLFGAAGDTKVLLGTMNRATPLMISRSLISKHRDSPLQHLVTPHAWVRAKPFLSSAEPKATAGRGSLRPQATACTV